MARVEQSPISADSTDPHTEFASKLALPFPRSAEIDIKRLCGILGISRSTASRMIGEGLFGHYKGIGSRKIEYASVVRYCERLRLEYCISDRTAPRPKTGRVRDRDLLPFPLDETIYVKDVIEQLDCSGGSVIKLIEEGQLAAYKVSLESSGCAWRIYGKSLERYVASLHTAAGKSPVWGFPNAKEGR